MLASLLARAQQDPPLTVACLLMVIVACWACGLTWIIVADGRQAGITTAEMLRKSSLRASQLPSFVARQDLREVRSEKGALR